MHLPGVLSKIREVIAPRHTSAASEKVPLLPSEVSLEELEDPYTVDLIQFLTPKYVVDAKAAYIDVHLMRVGRKKYVSSFSYATQEVSAKPGRQYIHQAGIATLEPGEEEVCIKVPILNDSRWNATTEFKVMLSDPVCCKVDDNNTTKFARVVVVDDGAFPNDEFRPQVNKGVNALNNIKLQLFWGVLKLMFRQDGIRWRTLLTIFYDQLRNAYKLATLIISLYMVDTLLDLDSQEGLLVKGNRVKTAWAVSLIICVPPFLFIICDLIVVHMDIEGHLQKGLSSQLLAKFMNYNAASRASVTSSDMVGALIEDVPHVITHGYMNSLKLLYLAGKVCVSVYFTISRNPHAWWAIIVVTVLLLVWTSLRKDIFVNAKQATDDREGDVSNVSDQIMLNMELISDYSQRPRMIDAFREAAEVLQNTRRSENWIAKVNMSLPYLLGPLLVAIYIALGVPAVLNKTLPLGVFLGMLTVFSNVCDDFSQIFAAIMGMISTLGKLTSLTELFNLPEESTDWIQSYERTKQIALDLRHAQAQRVKKDAEEGLIQAVYVPGIDRQIIRIKDMCFSYGGIGPNVSNSATIFRNLNGECKQGVICAVQASTRRGRSTLMALLAQKLFPVSGHIYVPPYLKIVSVPSEAVLFDSSVWENLVFGNAMANPYRVEKILYHFGVEKIIAVCQQKLKTRMQEFDGDNGGENTHMPRKYTHADSGECAISSLSNSERAVVSLARALITNPEVLTLDCPFMFFPEGRERQLLWNALVSVREDRGFKMPVTTKLHRRPRTLFINANANANALNDLVDICWILPSELGGEMKSYVPEKKMQCPSDIGDAVDTQPCDIPQILEIWKAQASSVDRNGGTSLHG